MGAEVEVLDLASCAFRAMGTDVNVLVLDGEDADLQWAHGEIERLEALWSRFQEQSEVSRLNRGAGCWVDVAPETVDLLGAALEAWEATDGAFDPVLGASSWPSATTGPSIRSTGRARGRCTHPRRSHDGPTTSRWMPPGPGHEWP